jgi:hypothetical protein
MMAPLQDSDGLSRGFWKWGIIGFLGGSESSLSFAYVVVDRGDGFPGEEAIQSCLNYIFLSL